MTALEAFFRKQGWSLSTLSAMPDPRMKRSMYCTAIHTSTGRVSRTEE